MIGTVSQPPGGAHETVAALKERVLIVDDDERVRWSLRERLTDEGHEVVTAACARDCVTAFAERVPGAVVLDHGLPDASGLDLLPRLREEHPEVPVIMLTGNDSLEHAVEAMRRGAFHYLTKPCDQEQLVSVLSHALATTRLEREVELLRRAHDLQRASSGLVGSSAAIERLTKMIRRIASSNASTVLLTGESGTGKGLIADSIHANSARADAPFVNITCSALPDALLESELFGHERGAFTGAHRTHQGLLETAHGGTVFLDEIGEMAAAVQAKLLRFLEEKAFRRVGGTATIRPDVRVIAATNRDLAAEVRRGAFREDLYYRLAVLHLHVPPLRERAEDIAPLIDHFMLQLSRELHTGPRRLEPSAVERLSRYPWPGNVRELRNAVERALLLCDEEVLSIGDFDLISMPVAAEGSAPFELPAGGVDLEEVERSLLRQALRRARGNQTRAARFLGLNRDQVRYRVSKFELDLSEFATD